MADDFDAQYQPDNTFEPTTFDVPQGDPDDGFELVEITHPDGIIEVEVPVGLSDEEVQGLQNYGNLIQQEKARQGVAFKGEVETMVARGIRNNNPGNIEYGTDQWDGMSATQDDDRFIKFESPEMGIRAMSKIMQTYKNKHGIDTVAGVINRWAPPSENDTSRYASYVASRMGIGVDDQVDLSDTAILSPLIQAMTFMENGENPYDEVVIGKGMQLAGLTPTKEEPPVNIAEGSVLEDVLAGLARLSPISSAAASEPTLPDSIDRADGATSSSLAGVGPGPRKPEAPNSVIAEAGPGPRKPQLIPDLGDNVTLPEKLEEVAPFFEESVIPVYGDHAQAAVKHMMAGTLERFGFEVPDVLKTPITEKVLDPDVLNIVRIEALAAFREKRNTSYEGYGRASQLVDGTKREKLGTTEQLAEMARSFFNPATAAGLTIGESSVIKLIDGNLWIKSDIYNFIEIPEKLADASLWLGLLSEFSDKSGTFAVSPKNQQKIEINLGPISEIEKFVASQEGKSSNKEVLPSIEANTP